MPGLVRRIPPRSPLALDNFLKIDALLMNNLLSLP